MIAAARPKARENLRFVQMDINHLSFSAVFDVIFSNAALHWVKNHERLYANGQITPRQWADSIQFCRRGELFPFF